MLRKLELFRDRSRPLGTVLARGRLSTAFGCGPIPWGTEKTRLTGSLPVERYFHEVFRYVERMDTQHWVLVCVAAVIVGVLCMRGFGSRSGY